MGKGEIWGRLALALAALEHQPVCDHGDELGVGGLALGAVDGVAEITLQRFQIAPVPCHLDGVADGTLHAGGRGMEPLGYLRYSTLVTALITSMSCTAMIMASRTY